MKNLKTLTLLMIVVITSAISCKKDKNNDPENSGNTYVYQGKTTKIASADYFIIDVIGTNTLSLDLVGEQESNYVQIFFHTSATTLPEGRFTYKDASVGGYDATKNFDGGNINLDIVTADVINSGTVTITKSAEDYTVTVDVSTSKGPMKASYTGKITYLH